MFQYSAFVNPYAPSIGALLARRGDIEARAAEEIGAINARAAAAKGEILGNTIGGVANALTSVPGRMEEQRQAQQRNDLTALDITQRRTQVTAAQRLDQTKQRINELVNDPSVFNEDGTFNLKSIVEKMQTLPGGAAGPVQPPDLQTVAGIIDPINESLTKARTAKVQWETNKTNALAHMAAVAYTLGAPNAVNPQGTYLEHTQFGLAALIKSGVVTSQEADDFLKPVVSQPELLPTLLQSTAARSTLPPIKGGPGDQFFDPNTRAPIPGMSVPDRATDGELDARAQALYAKRANGQPLTAAEAADLQGYESRKAGPKGAPVTPEMLNRYQQQIDAIVPPMDKPNSALRTLTLSRVQNARSIDDAEKAIDEASRQVGQINVAKNTVPAKIEVAVGGQNAKDAAAANGVTPAAIDQAAMKYAQTGEMSGLGMGNAVLRRQIMNRAAELYPNNTLAGNAAMFKANQASLQNVTKTLDTLSAFENTAGKNLDQFLALASKIPDTGVPWLNTPVRLVDEKLAGSDNMAAVNAARDVALREIARVTNDPKLSGSLTDAARAEVASLSPRDATFRQIKAVVNVLRQDMANVHSGLDEQKADIGRRLGLQPPATPGGPQLSSPNAGRGVTVTSPGGKAYTFGSQADADAFVAAARAQGLWR